MAAKPKRQATPGPLDGTGAAGARMPELKLKKKKQKKTSRGK